MRIRAGFRAAAVIAATALPLTLAGNAFASPRGDNGDVKIHNIATGTDEEAENPHVCQFYLDAFDFDGLQKVHWEIDAWAGSDSNDAKGTLAAQGDITLLPNGGGQTTPITLSDGHYKLFWTFAGENGKAKHKAFWVDCTSTAGSTGGTIGGSTGGSTGGTSGGGMTGGTTSTGGGVTGGSSTSGGTTTGGATSSPTTPAKPATSTTPATPASTPPTTTGNLAHTGANSSALIYAALAAAALTGAGYGLRRYAGSRTKA